jgi:uncharacterized protein YndB with AHSA1/START domain
MTAADRLIFRRVMPAPPARVFALWTDPESIRKWFGGEEVEVANVALDLQPGGAYSITVRDAGGTSVISGRFLVVVVPARLVYTWRLDGPLGTTPETTVTVEFRELGAGTELLLEHGPFPEPKVRALHAQGWENCFRRQHQLLQDADASGP